MRYFRRVATALKATSGPRNNRVCSEQLQPAVRRSAAGIESNWVVDVPAPPKRRAITPSPECRAASGVTKPLPRSFLEIPRMTFRPRPGECLSGSRVIRRDFAKRCRFAPIAIRGTFVFAEGRDRRWADWLTQNRPTENPGKDAGSSAKPKTR